jgi:hypothetical protein
MQKYQEWQISFEQAASAAVLTLGLGNEYFCRPQPLKEAKMDSFCIKLRPIFFNLKKLFSFFVF